MRNDGKLCVNGRIIFVQVKLKCCAGYTGYTAQGADVECMRVVWLVMAVVAAGVMPCRWEMSTVGREVGRDVRRLVHEKRRDFQECLFPLYPFTCLYRSSRRFSFEFPIVQEEK